ncbi:MAG: hypothetical protein HWD61_12560 [Parachlamydiaceae bacterium]|nr:MAG: hypothetical protein HWD61_12560 [Parachlamydiaceae bacterium]
MNVNVNQSVMRQVQAKLDQMHADWKDRYESTIANEESFARQEQQLIKHLNEIERPRLYEQLILETMVTSISEMTEGKELISTTSKDGFANLEKNVKQRARHFLISFYKR